MKTAKFVLAFLILSVTSCTTAIINEGATVPTEPQRIKYDPDVANIMFGHCITCHGGTAPLGDLLLNNYEDVRNATENGPLLLRIENESNPMPPSGLLTPENRAIIARWVEDGYLQN